MPIIILISAQKVFDRKVKLHLLGVDKNTMV